MSRENMMKLDLSREWCIRMAQLEGDAEIGAGRLAVDPVLDDEDTSRRGTPRRKTDVEGQSVPRPEWLGRPR